jgi:diguanylate cyclase (GGDEF)-like protein/PAS domain S-box-containing protein
VSATATWPGEAVSESAAPLRERQGDDYFRALLESASDVVAVVSGGGTIAYVSPAVERVLGWAPGERLGRSIFERIHPADTPGVVEAFTRLAQGGAHPARLSCRVRHGDGSWRVLEVTGTNHLRHPELAGIVLTGRDVTESRRSESARRQLMAVLDGTPDFVFTCDPNGRLLYANEAARAQLGVAEEDVRRTNLTELFPSWAAERLSSEALPAVFAAGVWRGDLAILRPDGREIPISQVLLAHRDDSGDVAFLSGTARDISDAKRAEAAVRESEERFRQLAENIQEVFWLVDRASWRILFVSPAFERVWGRSAAEPLRDASTILRAMHPADQVRGAGALERFFTEEDEREYRIVHPDGQVRWIRSRSFPVHDEEGRPYRIAGIAEDVTERRVRDELLHRLALHDSLTGLPNRAALLHRLQRVLERIDHRPEGGLSLLFIDLDRFKLINDSLGHVRGDELLVGIARRLETCVRPEDMVARLGGDEFAVLLHNTPRAADAARVAERIHASFAEPFVIGEQEVFAGSSIGIVPASGYEAPEDLIRDADIAMYRAKVGGRGTYRIFDAAMHADVVARLQMETDLRRALERKEFRLHFQPVIDLASGEIAAVEALVRWLHPQRGELLPADFLGVAEEVGAIIPLGWWALDEACRELAGWERTLAGGGALAVSVNLSAKHFARPELAQRVRSALADHGLTGGRLRIEITENVIIESGHSAKVFDELRELGVAIHVDDFGTGYSSLSYLDRYPIDTVKIDRSLVARIGARGEGGHIVRTVVMLARDLGLRVVAEGVETEEQLRQLRSLGCDYAQGFLFARPMAGGAAEELMRRTPRW